jgi:hypothetical protein
MKFLIHNVGNLYSTVNALQRTEESQSHRNVSFISSVLLQAKSNGGKDVL